MHISSLALLIALSSSSVLAQDATSTVTMSAAAQPTSSSYTNDNTYKDDMVKAHNFFREAHNATDLKWNETLEEAASDWADGCVFEHSGGPTGENLAMGYQNATANVDAWALERKDYNFDKGGFSKETGHFTQLVWRNTTSVGCARKNCEGENDMSGWLVVCEYYPPGNVMGANGDTKYFKDNVLKQTEGQATDTVESGVTKSDAMPIRSGSWAVAVLVAAGAGAIGVGW